MFMDSIHDQLLRCDLFISIGTSGAVYPAAGFAQQAKLHGAKLIELNLRGTEISPQFNELIEGPATLTVPKLVEELIQKEGAA